MCVLMQIRCLCCLNVSVLARGDAGVCVLPSTYVRACEAAAERGLLPPPPTERELTQGHPFVFDRVYLPASTNEAVFEGMPMS